MPHETPPEPSAPTEVTQSSDPAATVLAYLLAGPAAFGGIGWLLDLWLHTSFLVVVGLLCGLGLAFYTIWIRYGKT